jgi:hypothetical protein
MFRVITSRETGKAVVIKVRGMDINTAMVMVMVISSHD